MSISKISPLDVKLIINKYRLRKRPPPKNPKVPKNMPLTEKWFLQEIQRPINVNRLVKSKLNYPGHSNLLISVKNTSKSPTPFFLTTIKV